MRTHIIILVILFLVGCQKFRDFKDEADANGNERIRGRLFLYDDLTKRSTVELLGEKRVTIRYAAAADTLNFLYETTTDAEGYFEFKNLKDGEQYKINFNETIEGVLYRASVPAEAPDEDLRVVATVDRKNQRGFHVVIADSLKGTFPGMDICVFNSRQLFENNNCEQSVFKLATDTLGRVYQLQAPEGKYYFTGEATINSQTYRIRDSITVTDQLQLDTFLLTPRKAQNGMHYTVLDAFGGRVAHGDICVFTSRSLFSRDTCEGHNFQIAVGEDGTGERRDIPAGVYYIFMERTFGEQVYFARDTITVTDKLVKDTLWLQ